MSCVIKFFFIHEQQQQQYKSMISRGIITTGVAAIIRHPTIHPRTSIYGPRVLNIEHIVQNQSNEIIFFVLLCKKKKRKMHNT